MDSFVSFATFFVIIRADSKILVLVAIVENYIDPDCTYFGFIKD